jgi:hypothetical protein
VYKYIPEGAVLAGLEGVCLGALELVGGGYFVIMCTSEDFKISFLLRSGIELS